MKFKTVVIDNLGECKRESPLFGKRGATFIEREEGVVYSVHKKEILEENSSGGIQFFELAGPREKVYFDPKNIVCGIVTCGGLCPGINDVIQAIVVELSERYGVKEILGFRYGYLGLTKNAPDKPVKFTTESVDDLHHRGGTVLSSSRGAQGVKEMVNTLVGKKVKILFTIGGDGTMRGASQIAEYILEKGLDISVIAIPKTIDNDLSYVKMSFGFQTAVQESRTVIASAHIEAKGAPNGIGLVKLMGRHSGYIAAHATLANRDVNYCLIPEVPFRLEGEGGFFNVLERRLKAKEHAVIVVAEGAGQNLITGDFSQDAKDASGNVKLKDVGMFLKQRINEHFKKINTEVNVKYIDPSYIIRSVPANATDSTYCLLLGQNAVHAAMTGRTNMMVGYWNHHHIQVPIRMATGKKNMIDPNRRLWKTVMGSILQPESIFEK